MIERHRGGPVGLETLAACTGEDSGTIEEVYEPYLLQIGMLQRTPRGRIASDMAYSHLGLKPPKRAPGPTLEFDLLRLHLGLEDPDGGTLRILDERHASDGRHVKCGNHDLPSVRRYLF